MKKALQSKTTYEPNPAVKITVLNKPVSDDAGQRIGYDSKITVTTTVRRLEELTFVSDDDIADFVGAIDFTDPQQQMFANE